MRVLLLEDDADMRSAVAKFLATAGFAVDAVELWSEAHDRTMINEYDALVLDRSVPDGDSIDLLRTLRTDGNHTPALFLTARDAVDDRVAGLAAGADDYLVKPFAMVELVARVHALTRRSVVAAAPVLTIADISLDPTRQTATRSGSDLGLTVKEFAVLRYLLTYQDRIVSRTELIEHCWDEYAEPMSNVVDVKVAQLRKKLGEPAVLHTVRGVGYHLAAS